MSKRGKRKGRRRAEIVTAEDRAIVLFPWDQGIQNRLVRKLNMVERAGGHRGRWNLVKSCRRMKVRCIVDGK